MSELRRVGKGLGVFEFYTRACRVLRYAALIWRRCLQGKGANTPFILESRGLQRSETMSSLLERNPEIRDLMNQGELVPDTMVGLPGFP